MIFKEIWAKDEIFSNSKLAQACLTNFWLIRSDGQTVCSFRQIQSEYLKTNVLGTIKVSFVIDAIDGRVTVWAFV